MSPQVKPREVASLPAMIRTARLLLRDWKDEDLEPFAALNLDPAVREFFPSLETREESAAGMARARAHLAERGYGMWAAEVPGVAPFIGFIGLHFPHLPPPFEPKVEIGWRLAKEHWGHGYATEGALASLKWGFEVSKLEEIVAMTAVTNKRSWSVMEKLGMQRADDFNHPGVPAGHPLERHVMYRLSRSEWIQR